jgi:hypothetical protein
MLAPSLDICTCGDRSVDGSGRCAKEKCNRDNDPIDVSIFLCSCAIESNHIVSKSIYSHSYFRCVRIHQSM